MEMDYLDPYDLLWLHLTFASFCSGNLRPVHSLQESETPSKSRTQRSPSKIQTFQLYPRYGS